jgi:hypothetical protein
MSVLREKIFEREGKGILKPQNTKLEHIEIPVTFTCAQYRDGDIDGTITVMDDDHAPYMDLFHTHEAAKFRLCANLDGEELNIERLSIQTDERVEYRDIAFIADYLKLKHREITAATNRIFCRFDVSNLKTVRTTFEIEEGKVTFFQYGGDIWKAIEIYKKSGITGVVKIELNDDVRLQTIDAYKSLVFNKISKILRLASLSQGTYIDWASFVLCAQNSESEYERIYTERKNIRTEFSARHELTPYGDLSNYFKKTYPNYTDTLNSELGFYPAVEWYCESLNRSLLESKYLGLFTVLETIIYRFAITQKPPRVFILADADFKRFKEELKKPVKEALRALSMDTENRKALYLNLPCLNRYSFKDNLILFLGYYKIGYSDIIADLGDLITVRDNITHKGISEREFDALIDAYDKLMAFVHRIFLALLNYDANSKYRNWINKHLEIFKKDPNSDW